MKKIDILLSIITGLGVGILFGWMINKQVAGVSLMLILPIAFAFLCVVGLWISYLIGKKFLFIYQLVKFVLIGVFFALFDLTILNSLMAYYGISKGLAYIIFVTISFAITTSVKYFFDKFWAFEKSGKSEMGNEFSKFFAVTIVSLIIQVGIAAFIVNIIGARAGISDVVWANIGKIAGIFFASAWNFVGYKFFVFKK